MLQLRTFCSLACNNTLVAYSSLHIFDPMIFKLPCFGM